MSKNTDKTPAAPATAALMYVGPTTRSPMPLQRGSVFANGLPPLVKAQTDKDADLAALFLPLKEAGQALRQLEAGSSPLIKHINAVAAKARSAEAPSATDGRNV